MKYWDIAPQHKKALHEFPMALQYWQWFRELCIRFYKVSGLPETFGEQEGKIHEHHWVDPEEDWTAPPPEYNYDWRTQDLVWTSGEYQILFSKNDDTYTRYIRFEIKTAKTSVKVRLSQFSKGEAVIQETEELTQLWEHEIRALEEKIN